MGSQSPGCGHHDVEQQERPQLQEQEDIVLRRQVHGVPGPGAALQHPLELICDEEKGLGLWLENCKIMNE